MSNDSTVKTLVVALCLCIFCSVLVSTAAIKLKPLQEINKAIDVQKNLLLAASLIDNPKASKEEVIDAFSSIEVLVVNLETGELVKDIDTKSFDQYKPSKDPSMTIFIPREKDLAGIKKRSKYAKVYLDKKSGRVDQIILPFHGKGLWSTMYGFLSLAPDTMTVKGIGYYQHVETPGLGGEVENPKWTALWTGKKVYDQNYKPAIDVIKGRVDSSSAKASYQIDGLSGATITSNGVEGMINYWMSDHGFGKFLAKFRQSNEGV